MSNDSSKQEQAPFVPQASVFSGPIAELVGHRLLSPPNRPGLLATLSRYEVLRVLGSGGMGVVLLARDGESGREVALKMVRPELVSNQQVVHRFVKEAGHLQKLKHPNIIPVLEISDRAEGPYFVMPYFEQGSMAAQIKPGQGYDSSTVLEIALQVAQGLQFAHRRGIIHRDLKPANILLGAGNSACLADFGLARTMFNDTILDVESDRLEGTAPYMSPGVAAGNAEDTRCDIYAFGAVLYEMLTGDPPYVGRNTQDVRKQILAGPPKPIRQRNPEADACLAAVAEGAMGRELRNRYADMTDVLSDLERVKQGRKPTGPHGMAKRVRHVPIAAWVGLAAMAAVAVWWAVRPPVKEKVTIFPPPGPVTQTNVVAHPPVTNPPPPSNPPPIQVVAPPKWSPPIIVGGMGEMGAMDGFGTAARFASPVAIAANGTGYVFVADMGNNTIRKISPGGDVITLAGSAGKPGEIDKAGSEARFTAPRGIAAGRSGNVYVAEFVSGTVRKISPEGFVSLLAGSPGHPGWKDARGDNAHFRNPWALAVDRDENVYVTDKDNFVIRKISPDGDVTTIAGKPGVRGFADGTGEAARFDDCQGIAVDRALNVYVADTGNQTIRKISPKGEVTSLASGLFRPVCVVVDGKGDVYSSDSIGVHKIAGGNVELLPPLLLTANPDGPVAQADGIALGPGGTLYIVDTSKGIVCWQPTK